jgi:hypothetical protein
VEGGPHLSGTSSYCIWETLNPSVATHWPCWPCTRPRHHLRMSQRVTTRLRGNVGRANQGPSADHALTQCISHAQNTGGGGTHRHDLRCLSCCGCVHASHAAGCKLGSTARVHRPNGWRNRAITFDRSLQIVLGDAVRVTECLLTDILCTRNGLRVSASAR